MSFKANCWRRTTHVARQTLANGNTSPWAYGSGALKSLWQGYKSSPDEWQHRRMIQNNSRSGKDVFCQPPSSTFSRTDHVWCPGRWLVGWLVVLGLTTLWDSISVYIRPSPRETEKEKRSDRWEKNVRTTPPAPTASAIGPCPTVIQISRTPRHLKFTQHLRTTRPPPWKNMTERLA